MLLTTHYMDEAERLCDRVAIVDHGKVIALGTPAELDRLACTRRTSSSSPSEPALAGGGRSTRCPASRDVPAAPTGAGSVGVASHVTPCRRCSPRLDRGGRELVTLSTHRATLEDVFVSLTGRELRDE